MQVFETIAQLRAALHPLRLENRTIGFVPTMGYLHEGHMSLVDNARRMSDVVVVSIFVNPTQFGPTEDLDSYPRDLPRDLDLCREHGVDFVFAPTVGEMYPEAITTSIDVKSLSGILIGLHRPGHFQGVATVVTKLFNIVQPDQAFFGEKDFQQLAVIRRMTRELSSRVSIVGIPTVREPDGLAFSSRNAKLTPEDRAAAVVVPQALRLAESLVEQGERDVATVRDAMRALIGKEPRAVIQSIDICDADTLEQLTTFTARPAVALITARFGDVLLIDQQVIRSGGSA